MTNEAKTWTRDMYGFQGCLECERPALLPIIAVDWPGGGIGKCTRCRADMTGSRAKIEESERVRLIALWPRGPYLLFIGEDGGLCSSGAKVNITPWPDAKPEPAKAKTWEHEGQTFCVCEKCGRPCAIYQGLVARCGACTPGRRCVRSSEEAERRRLADHAAGMPTFIGNTRVNLTPWPDKPDAGTENMEQWLDELAEQSTPTYPDLRALHDPRPDPIPDGYGTDAAQLEQALEYWATVDPIATPCGHDKQHIVRGYCVACAWDASGASSLVPKRRE